ncbi:MAG TPA: hypothetical protein VNM48_13935, partial [Chloroflexota bacterium]|nr:hypothetical protein [Chloroflexota bacterium]
MAAAPTDLPKDAPEPQIEIGNARAGIVLGETSGRLLGVYNRATGTAYLSESPTVRDLRYELAIVARTPEGAFVTALPPAQAAAVKRTDEEGAQAATIVYDHLEGPDGPLAVRATIHIRVPLEGEETIWSLELENRSQATLHEVLFPRITGVTLGSAPATTELIYP